MTLKRICSGWILCLLAAGILCRPAEAQSKQGMQLDHVAIYVSDLNASVAFYKDVFGFQQVPMPVKFAAWLSMGKGVMLHIVAGRKEQVSNSRWDHVSIACGDLDAMIAAPVSK